MGILVFGLNHKTASVEVRQRLAFDLDSTGGALGQLKDKWADGEFVILSTCNRVEFYCAGNGEVDHEQIARFVGDMRGIGYDEFKEFLYVHRDGDAVRHLMTVASSLDSMVVGEPQIVTQVKDSYKVASEAGATGKTLNRMFHTAFSVGKEIYSGTSIASGRVSIAGVAVDLAKQLFANISKAKIAILGAGQMSELLVEHLVHQGCGDITVINRTSDRGRKLAEKHGIKAGVWADVDAALLDADIVVAAAAAGQGYLFDKQGFAELMGRRKNRMMLAVDIAVPRNLEPEINEIENVYLYCIDDLAQVVQGNIKLRQEDVDSAVEIICRKAGEFMDWHATRDIGPLIGRVKENFDRIRAAELEKFFTGRRQDADCRGTLEQVVARVVNKLLHSVIKNIDAVAREQGPEEAARLAEGIAGHAEQMIEEELGDSE